MSDTLTIDGSSYVPLVQAAQHLGYTREYVLTHVHDGKFDARKINNRWYVNLTSAREYFTHTKKTIEEKRDALRQIRKVEYVKHAKNRTSHHVALVETLAVVVIGLSLGVMGYLGVTPQTQVATVTTTDTSFIDTLSLSLYTFISGETTQDTTPTQSAEVIASTETTPRASSDAPALIVSPADSFTEGDVSAIQDSFSDPITIVEDTQNPDTGIITPIFKEGREGTPYRYLMVPVEARDVHENTSLVPADESLMTSTEMMQTNQN